MRTNLYPYQESILSDILSDREKDPWKKDYVDVIVQLPTGGGKSWIIAALVHHYVDERRPVLVVSHRIIILDQLRERLDYNKLLESNTLVRIASIQKLQRMKESEATDNFYRSLKDGLVVIDEAHRAASQGYADLMTKAPSARYVGFTATPARGDGKPLGAYFDRMILGKDHNASYRELIEGGYLVDISKTYSIPAKNSYRGVKVVAGDYTMSQVALMHMRPKHVGNCVKQWKKCAEDRPTLVFCCTVEHCYTLANKFREEGVSAEVVIGKTDSDTRHCIINQLQRGFVKVIVTCLVFTEGVDIPEVSCILIDRPTKLLGLYIQMVGRGLRTAKGKSDCILIDHCGVALVHGVPTHYEVPWQLTKELPPVSITQRLCRACGRLLESNSRCPCGARAAVRRPRELPDDTDDELVLTNTSLNPLGFYWRDDVRDAQFRLLRSLSTPNRSLRDIIHEFIMRQDTGPPLQWFLPNPVDDDEELLTNCLHIVLAISPPADPKNIHSQLLRAFRVFRDETGELPYKHVASAVVDEYHNQQEPTYGDISEYMDRPIRRRR